ncbi:MAG: queuosine precursor transporter [Anaerolineae bacterium]|nr:queuosine precursor transporter [Anaerolineae bacterium]
METRKNYQFFDLIMALFVTVLLISNLLSSAKIIDLDFSIAGLDFLFDAGTLVFPISYIFGDVLTEVYGYKRSRRVIWTGFAATAILGFFVWFAGVLPGETEWASGYDGSIDGAAAYDFVLGGISGLIVASLVAYFAGEFSNSYVLAKMKVATEGRFLPLRTIGSTLVGQGVDTTIFFIIAVALGVFPASLMLSLIVTNYLFKVGVEVLLTPLTLQVVNLLKQVENEDYYDRDTDFNPFHLAV